MQQDARYSRQSSLAQIGAVGQARLAKAHLCLSFSSLPAASVAVAYLAGAGIGTLTILDNGSRVEAKDVAKSLLLGEESINKPAASALCAAARALNHRVHCQVESATPAGADAIATGEEESLIEALEASGTLVSRVLLSIVGEAS